MSWLHTPLSLYSIPVIWYTAFYPMNRKYLFIQNAVGYNNIQPRSNTENLPKEISDKAKRMEGAHLNGNEVLPLWVAGVLAANFAGLPHKTVNLVSAAYISVRIAYNYVYINGTTELMSLARTILFFGGLSFPFYLIIKAGNVVRNKALF